MQKIIPHLWFDSNTREAVEFYVSVFPKSKITSSVVLHNTPSGDCEVISFDIWEYSFMSINGGPYFHCNPSISFMINFDPSRDEDAKVKIKEIWESLVIEGKILMPLDKYPFSELYGWVEDKYGVSWQLILTDPSGEERPRIMPAMLFVGKVCGKTEEAVTFYVETFKNSKTGMIAKYPKNMEPDIEGTVMFSDFVLENQWFVAMDSAHKHDFGFSEGVSLIINCETQKEIDYYWEKLSAEPEAEQCGWLKDKFGVSWQITPTIMTKMYEEGTPEQIDKITQAFLEVKKFNIEDLEKVYNSIGD